WRPRATWTSPPPADPGCRRTPTASASRRPPSGARWLDLPPATPERGVASCSPDDLLQRLARDREFAFEVRGPRRRVLERSGARGVLNRGADRGHSDGADFERVALQAVRDLGDREGVAGGDRRAERAHMGRDIFEKQAGNFHEDVVLTRRP